MSEEQITGDNTNFNICMEGVLKLHEHALKGTDESDEAEELKDSMDGPWYKLSETDQERIRKKSAELNDVEDEIRFKSLIEEFNLPSDIEASICWQKVLVDDDEGYKSQVLTFKLPSGNVQEYHVRNKVIDGKREGVLMISGVHDDMTDEGFELREREELQVEPVAWKFFWDRIKEEYRDNYTKNAGR